jgi:hypothetical protein
LNLSKPSIHLLGTVVVLILGFLLSACSSIVNKASATMGRQISAGILNQDDPEIVATGLPAYLLLVDGLLSSNPNQANVWFAASRLYGAYASGFVDQPERRKRLSLKAEMYARQGVCLHSQTLCAAIDQTYEAMEPTLNAAKNSDTEALYSIAVAWAGVLQADSSDWNRIADLPKVELLLQKVRMLDRHYDHGAASMYLGVLNCLRPESLGGKPQEGLHYFEEALTLSKNQNLMAYVLDAQYCARLLFDQERHDRLLNQVLIANTKAPDLTLANILAQQQAKKLLISGKDYF